MKYLYSLGGGQQLIREIPVKHSATALVKGALLIKGATDDTDEAFAKIWVASGADIVGVLEEAAATTETDSNADGTAVLLKKVTLNPDAVYLCEYDQAAASTPSPTSSSGTTYTHSSIEGIAGGWLYVAGGTGAGQLQWVVSDGSGSLVTKTAFDPVLDSTSEVVKILPQFHALAELIANGSKFITQAAAGTLNVCILENFIEADNIPFQRLNPAKHSGLTGLNSQNVKFYSEVYFRDHLLNPLS